MIDVFYWAFIGKIMRANSVQANFALNKAADLKSS